MTIVSKVKFPIHLFAAKRFPEQVFTLDNCLFGCDSYSRAFGSTWNCLAFLARYFDDPYVSFKSIEHHGVYERDLGVIPEFDFASTDDGKIYSSFMCSWPIGPPRLGEPSIMSDVVAWAGRSGLWAGWGERSCELSVLCAPPEAIDALLSAGFGARPLDAANLDAFSYNEFTPDEFEEFSAKMLKNYPSKY